MNIAESIRVALLSLWANKLRSVLTLLGVVIGVAAVIAVVTFVNGINGYVAEKIFNLGANVFIVSKTPNVITDVDQFIEGQKRKEHDDGGVPGRRRRMRGVQGRGRCHPPVQRQGGLRNAEQHRHHDSRLDSQHGADL